MEVLELTDAFCKDIVYIILYNIVTSSQPRLKHLKIHGSPFGLQYFLQLFLKTRSNLSVYKPCTSVQFAFLLPNPYPLEGLSVHCLVHDIHEDMISKLQSLVVFHMHTLKHVTIQGIRFCYANNSTDARYFDKDSRVEVVDMPSFATLLSSSFTQLLKQPQFHALSVGESPLSGACALIETFLTTPASHEQTLHAEGLDEHDLMER